MTLINIPDRFAKWPVIRNLAVSASKNIRASQKKQSDKDIILKIVQEFKDNTRKNIDEWRQALDAATDINNPSWAPLQDLYDYLEPDAQLGTSKDIRVASTLGKKYMIYSKKTGTEIPEKTELFMKSWFFNFTWNFLDSVFNGYTVAQLIDPEFMRFSYIPRRNIIPQKDFVRFKVYENEGLIYTDPAFADSVIAVKYKHKFGILNDIVPNLIWKKNARQAWAEFSEKFGIPLISATTTKADKTTLDRIETMLKSLGEAATAVLPEGTTVTIHDQVSKGDPYLVFSKQIELDDQQIAKRLLGGTMITDGGSSRSQSEVHERTLKDVIGLFDKMLIVFTVNDYLLPMMVKYGGFTEDDAFKFDETEKIPLKDHWDIVYQALDKFDIDIEWVAKTFNMPVTGVKAQAPTANFNKPFNAIAAALKGKGITLPDYTSSCSHKYRQPVADGFTDRLLSELSDVLINELWEGKDTLITEVLKSIATHKHLLDGLYEGYSNRLDIGYDTIDNHCLAMMDYNLFEFSRMKEKGNVFALNELLLDKEKNNVRTAKEFRDQALPFLHNADVTHLNTERNHTIAVGQNASRYNQFWNERDIMPFIQYQTVGDDHVRPKHQALDNKIFRINDPQARAIWPPNDWGCRCEFLQYTATPAKDQVTQGTEALQTLGFKEGDKWAINRGETQQVFIANEYYVQSQGLATEINKLTYSSYKLPAASNMKDLPKLNLDKTITEDNVGDLWKPKEGKDYMGYEDYLKRKIIVPKSVFDYHTKGKYTNDSEERHRLFPLVKDILSNPDEVYFTKYEGKPGKPQFQANYIKFYDGQPVVVNTKTGSNNVEVNTWYKAKVKDENYRKGYLIQGLVKS